MSAERSDVIVAGGGPNGLTTAAYLRRAGADVVVLEQSHDWGGTMATDDFSTSFYYNLCQYTLPVGEELPPYTDLNLHAQGIQLLQPDPVAAFMPRDGGTPLVVGRGGSGLDSRLVGMLSEIEQVVTPLLYLPPVSTQETESTLQHGGADKALELARLSPAQVAGMESDSRARALLRYLCGTLGFVNGEEPLGLMGALGLAKAFRPTLVAGGPGSLARALFRSGARSGVHYRNTAEVATIDTSDSQVRALCRDGREFVGRTIVSTLDPKTTFLDLLEDSTTPQEMRVAADSWELDSVGFFVAHFGIKGEPPKTATDESSQALMQIVGFSDENSVIEHLDNASRGQLPTTPSGHLTVTTMFDSFMAAPGPYGPLHTLRFETIAPPIHPDGAWTRANTTAYRNACLELVRANTRGLEQASVLFAFSDSPSDLQRRFHTARNGSVRQGRITPGQTFTNRPHHSCSNGKTPASGLYLGGGGVHPGLPGTLAGGYRAADAVCEDTPDLVHWWPEPDLVTQARDAGTVPTARVGAQ